MFSTYLRLNLHTADPATEVIRRTRQIIQPHHRRCREKRDARHRLYSQMLTFHRQAGEFHQAVMAGDFA